MQALKHDNIKATYNKTIKDGNKVYFTIQRYKLKVKIDFDFKNTSHLSCINSFSHKAEYVNDSYR